MRYNKVTQLFENLEAGDLLVPGESYYLYCLRDATWTIKPVDEVTEFVYDGDGGRVKKVTETKTTIYIGSLYEKDSNGTITKHIFLGSNRICTVEDDGVALERVRYYHSDHLGSSNVITDETGQLAQLLEYKPYGQVELSTGDSTTNYKFTGKELDSSTGLYYYGARYYDAEIGRFITADSIVQAPFDPQSLNRYSYCRNNPIIYIDPSGHIFGAIAAIINAVVNVVAAVVSAVVSAVGAAIAAHPVAAASGAVIGGTLGGVSAKQSGGNLYQGILLGGTIGAITGAWSAQVGGWLSSETSPFATGGFNWAERAITTGTEFSIAGFGAGATVGFAGGEGSFEDVLVGGFAGAGYGFVSGALIGGTNGFGLPKLLHGASFVKEIASNPITPGLITAAQAITIATPIPGDEVIIFALAVVLSAAASSQIINEARSTTEHYPGYNKGKQVRRLRRSRPKPVPPAHNPAPNPMPPDNKWKKFLDNLASLLNNFLPK